MKLQGSFDNDNHLPVNAGLHRFAITLIGMIFVLLIVGALVTSNEAGDSVPDWPLSFGRWLIHSDYFIANVRYEYSHRFIAGVVAFTTFLLAVWAWRSDRRGWLKKLAWLAFFGVIAQALIGGVRVLFPDYKAAIAVPHALIAQSYLAVVVSLAVFSSKSWVTSRRVRPDWGNPALRRVLPLTLIAVLVQLVLGAGFRHRAFGIIPHVIGALAVAGLILWTVMLVMRRHGKDEFLRKPALTLAGLLFTQLLLGILAYLARLATANEPQPVEPMISLTVAHVVVGALTLTTLVVLTLRCYRALAPTGERTREAHCAPVAPSDARGAAA